MLTLLMYINSTVPVRVDLARAPPHITADYIGGCEDQVVTKLQPRRHHTLFNGLPPRHLWINSAVRTSLISTSPPS